MRFEQWIDSQITEASLPATLIAALGATVNPASSMMMTPANLIRAVVMTLKEAGWAGLDILKAIKSIPQIMRGDLSTIPPVAKGMLSTIKTGAKELYQALVAAPARIANAHLGGNPDSYGNELRRTFGQKMYASPEYGAAAGYKDPDRWYEEELGSLTIREKVELLHYWLN
jgi:hypothetical protein